MTSPLGGLRRNRKRLKRCAHNGLTVWDDPSLPAVKAACSRCGATAVVTLDEIRSSVPTPGPYLLMERMPSRIARKAADA
jgi:hypothetical protein